MDRWPFGSRIDRGQLRSQEKTLSSSRRNTHHNLTCGYHLEESPMITLELKSNLHFYTSCNLSAAILFLILFVHWSLSHFSLKVSPLKVNYVKKIKLRTIIWTKRLFPKFKSCWQYHLALKSTLTTNKNNFSSSIAWDKNEELVVLMQMCQEAISNNATAFVIGKRSQQLYRFLRRQIYVKC